MRKPDRFLLYGVADWPSVQKREREPLSPLGAVLAGVVMAVFAVSVAVTTKSPVPVLFLLFVVPVVTSSVRSENRRRKGSQRRQGAAPLPEWAQRRADQDLADARRRFDTLRAEYAAFECDPVQVLRLPALTDVSVPSTARFVNAFAQAQALHTDTPAPRSHGAAFIAAVDQAERAWEAARDAARRIRLSRLSPEERRTVERVVKILTTARDTDSEPERLVAYARARAQLATLDRNGTVHVPGPAISALHTAVRPELPGS